MTKTLQILHEGLSSRLMPETVARTLLDIVADDDLSRKLKVVANARAYHFSSMQSEWFEPVSPTSQIATALALFKDYIAANPSPDVITASEKNPLRIEKFIAYLSRSLHKEPGGSDFKHNRLNRAFRHDLKVGLGSHAYNKRFRFLGRFEEKLKTYTAEARMLSYRMIGKGGLVNSITLAEFEASPAAAAFVAYYVARKNRRSIFTNSTQSRPFDTVAESLLNACWYNTETDWSLIARVYPSSQVLDRLDDQAKGKLLGAWLNVLVSLATDLETAWRKSDINLDTMIVRRGNDSSTWNLAAQAWNTSRTAWMALLADTHQDGFLTDCCPGKVLRLMAGDVAFWHRSSGGNVHPDTLVWRQLPKPWAVLRGEVACTRSMVEQACADAGLDPTKSGWIEGRVSKVAEAFKPTPELVYGVEVSSPYCALIFRKMGIFSGKKLKLPVEADVLREV